MKSEKEEYEMEAYIQFRLPQEEKEEIKEFVDTKKTSMSKFIRNCVRFFLNKNMTPAEYLMQQADSISLDKAEIPEVLYKMLEARDQKVEKQLNDINTAIKSVEFVINKGLIEHTDMIVTTLRGGE